MKRLVLTLCFLLLSSVVHAQAHPCDLPPSLNASVITGQSGSFAICFDGKDTNGNQSPTTAIAMYDNGARTTPPFTAGTTSAVSGKTLYTIAGYVVPNVAGTRTVQFAVVNAKGEGAKQPVPFVLTVSLPQTVPTAPLGQSFQ